MNGKTWLFIILVGLVALVGLWEIAPYDATIPQTSDHIHWPTWLVRQYWEVPVWVYILLGIAVLWYALTRPHIGFGWVTTSFSTGSFLMKLITSFLVLATFFFLLSKIYPNAPLFQPGEGYGHIALYFLLAGLMALVAANLEGKAWFVNFVLVVLMFVMIGHRTAELLDPSGNLFANFRRSWGGGSTAPTSVVNVVTRPGCAGVYERITLTTVPTPIGDCHFDFRVVSGEILLTPQRGRPVLVAAGEHVDIDLNQKFLQWKAVTSTALVHAAFCPYGTGWNGTLNRCT